MVLDLALVGTGGMVPLPNRWLSSVLIRLANHLVLFDCGEGTQISLRALGWGIKHIDVLLISHLHGDHITGLPGLVLTQGNAGRTEPLLVIGPTGLQTVAEGLLRVAPRLPFAVECREIGGGAVLDFDGFSVRSATAEHHVPCLAYRLDVPRRPRFLPDRATALGVAQHDWGRLQRGDSIDGVNPEDVLGPPRRGLSLGLVTDTRPVDAVAQLVKDVDVLVAEAMYGSDDDQPRAVERKHMTFREAAELAVRALARQLVLTHFSPSVTDPDAYAANARSVFGATIVGHDHLTLNLRFDPD